MTARRKIEQLEDAQLHDVHPDKSVAVMDERKEAEIQSRFSKEQLYASARYADRKDLVMALLEDGRGYTIEEVDNIIAGYLHGKTR